MEDNKEKGKEIALTGKYAVIRAFKKILKDPIAEEVLKTLKIKDYKTSSNGEIKIFESVKINNIVVALNEAKVDVLAINSSDESVEDYYLNLIRRIG